MASISKLAKPLFLALLVIFGAAFTQLTFTSSSVSALTNAEQQQCMNELNNKTDTQLTDSQKNFYNTKCSDKNDGGICKTDSRVITTGTSTVTVTIYICTLNPDDVDQSNVEDATPRAKAAEVNPLQTLICGEAPTNVTVYDNNWLPCATAVANTYNGCGYNNAPGAPTNGAQIAANATASCMRPKLGSISGAKTPTITQLVTAINSGRDAYQKIMDDAIAADTAAGSKTECEKAGGTWADGKCAEKAAVLCSGGPLGWIMCPLAELAASITESLAKIISGIMTFSPLLNSDQGKAIQTVWQLIVNIANVLLVIAFLFVVFSQATSVGLSNYGIKKMLPKIIAAAILMNLSFFICAVAVDISNILGQSVAGIIQVGINALPDPAAGSAAAGIDLKHGSDGGDKFAFTALLAGIGIPALILAPGLLYFTLPILISVAAAIFTAFAVIMFRQVALVIMIILSPLAFVAWVLPNTESWFEKWRKFFIALLLMFPLIMAIFYGSTFVSYVILLTSEAK